MILRPHPVGDLRWARCTHETLRGDLAVSWRRSGDALELEVNIPANVTATLHLPTTDAGGITESDQPLRDCDHAGLVNTAAGVAVLELESGAYRLRSPLEASAPSARLNAATASQQPVQAN